MNTWRTGKEHQLASLDFHTCVSPIILLEFALLIEVLLDTQCVCFYGPYSKKIWSFSLSISCFRHCSRYGPHISFNVAVSMNRTRVHNKWTKFYRHQITGIHFLCTCTIMCPGGWTTTLRSLITIGRLFTNAQQTVTFYLFKQDGIIQRWPLTEISQLLSFVSKMSLKVSKNFPWNKIKLRK